MKILWIDPSGGLAGDMLCGALLDAGASFEVAQQAVNAMDIPAVIDCEKVTRGSFSASFFQVKSEEIEPPSRHLSDIVRLIETSGLTPYTKDKAIHVFRRLASVEAQAHGLELDKVHFHEVGAIDSIVDIVVFCALAESLEIDAIVGGPIPVGEGSIEMAHGIVSLPTPALLGLCEEWTLDACGRRGEQSTPTGAALVTTLGQEGSFPGGKALSQGRGAGTRNPPNHANITRVVVLQNTAQSLASETIHILECQVDDMLPEWIPELIEVLLQRGAVDVTCTPTLMKKGRPGFSICVFTDAHKTEELRDVLFQHSSTLGIRHRVEDRWILERKQVTVETPWGPCRIKKGLLRGKTINHAPEFEDCRILANKSGLPLQDVYKWVLSHAPTEDE